MAVLRRGVRAGRGGRPPLQRAIPGRHRLARRDPARDRLLLRRSGGARARPAGRDGLRPRRRPTPGPGKARVQPRPVHAQQLAGACRLRGDRPARVRRRARRVASLVRGDQRRYARGCARDRGGDLALPPPGPAGRAAGRAPPRPHRGGRQHVCCPRRGRIPAHEPPASVAGPGTGSGGDPGLPRHRQPARTPGAHRVPVRLRKDPRPAAPGCRPARRDADAGTRQVPGRGRRGRAGTARRSTAAYPYRRRPRLGRRGRGSDRRGPARGAHGDVAIRRRGRSDPAILLVPSDRRSVVTTPRGRRDHRPNPRGR